MYVDIGTAGESWTSFFLAGLETLISTASAQACRLNNTPPPSPPKLSALTARRCDTLLAHGFGGTPGTHEPRQRPLFRQDRVVASAPANPIAICRRMEVAVKRLVSRRLRHLPTPPRGSMSAALSACGTPGATPLFTLADQKGFGIYVPCHRRPGPAVQPS